MSPRKPQLRSISRRRSPLKTTRKDVGMLSARLLGLPLAPAGMTNTKVSMEWNALSVWYFPKNRKSASLLTRTKKRLDGQSRIPIIFLHMLTLFLPRLDVLRALVGHIPPHPLWAELLWQRQDEVVKGAQQPMLSPSASRPPAQPSPVLGGVQQPLLSPSASRPPAQSSPSWLVARSQPR